MLGQYHENKETNLEISKGIRQTLKIIKLNLKQYRKSKFDQFISRSVADFESALKEGKLQTWQQVQEEVQCIELGLKQLSMCGKDKYFEELRSKLLQQGLEQLNLQLTQEMKTQQLSYQEEIRSQQKDFEK